MKSRGEGQVIFLFLRTWGCREMGVGEGEGGGGGGELRESG